MDVGEFYSEALVIITETSEDQWERFNANNPIMAEMLMTVFGDKAKYMLQEVKSDVTDDDIVNLVTLRVKGKNKKRPIRIKRSRLSTH